MERDDLHSGFTRLDWDASERKAIHDRLVAIDNKMTRRGSRGFGRFLLAALIGVAATLAWQSYGDATKQVIAAKAPELGWSPEAKQMIASWTLGWTKPPVVESKAAPVARNVAPKAPATPFIDPEQVQQMARDLAALRQTVEQLAAGQDQMVHETAREMARLESSLVNILLKIPEPPPQRRGRR